MSSGESPSFLYQVAFRYPDWEIRFPLSQIESIPDLISSEGKSAIYGIGFEDANEYEWFYFLVRFSPEKFYEVKESLYGIPFFDSVQKYQPIIHQNDNAITSFQELSPSHPDGFGVIIGRLSEAPRVKRDEHGLFRGFSMIDKHGCTACCQLYTDDFRDNVGDETRDVRKGDLAVCVGFFASIDVCVEYAGERVNVLRAAFDSRVMLFNQ